MADVQTTSFSFTTQPNHEGDKKIEEGLRKECEFLTGIRENFKTHSIYAKSENAFAGGINFGLHGDILWIGSIWIDSNFRGQGVGKKLLQEATLFAIQNKAKEIQLNTYFQEAHRFFLVCGFEDVVIIPDWKYGLTAP
ncbi:MAG: GNAT family N-acetyltransferase [Alphaproteobacteria bacterium]